MPLIFISHANEDETLARAVCAFLESHGVTCWLARRDNRPGRSYAEELILAIERADGVVLLLSERANAAPFVRREIERAGSKEKPIFSLKVDDAKLSPALELFVGPAHWVDARQPPVEDHLPTLLAAIADTFGQGEGEGRDLLPATIGWTPPPQPATLQPAGRPAGRARWPRILALAVLVLLAATAGLWLSMPARRFVFENASGSAVAAVYIVPSPGAGPGDEILGAASPLSPNKELTLRVPGPGYACIVDIRIAGIGYTPDKPDAEQQELFVDYPREDVCAEQPQRITFYGRRFVIVNESPYRIFYVWTTPTRIDNWGSDILGERRTFASNVEAILHVPGFYGDCDFDIMIADERYDLDQGQDGQEAASAAYYDINVCSEPPPRITYRR